MQLLTKLSEDISYLPARENPLSADVVFITQPDCCWIFDVGTNEDAYNYIEEISLPKNIVLSHFHQDHVTNLNRISYNNLYVGLNKVRTFPNQKIVTEPKALGNIKIIPLTSSHSKGSLVLQYEDYAFLGDAVYPTEKAGRPCYNSGQLLDEIRMLKSLDVKYFCISHAAIFVKPKENIITHLEEIYSKRKGNEPYIWL